MTKRKRQHRYTIGSISSGTMRDEDLIPAFLSQLEHELKYGPAQSRETRKRHTALVRGINQRIEQDNYYGSDEQSFDLGELSDALGEYAAPYFYFGAHPGDGADYGYWLSESWDEDFYELEPGPGLVGPIKVSDLSEIPAKYRGEVAVVNDHGNVTLYNKTARKLTEIWGIV